MKLPRRGWFLVALAVFSMVAAAARAADHTASAGDRRHLADWIGDDVGLCIEFGNVAQQWADFSAGPLFSRLKDHQAAVQWWNGHRAQLEAINREVARRTGASIREIVTRLPGREMVFAIWPPANPESDKPAALLLAEANDRELMQRTLDNLVAARRRVDRWRGTRRLQIGGETAVIETVVSDDEHSEFLITLVDSVAIIATNESLLHDVLDRRASPKDRTDSLASAETYLAARERLPAGDAARLFVNPRAWDDSLAADLKRKQPNSEEARSQAVVVAAWRATDYVAGALRLTPQLGMELAWQWRAEDLPEGVREVTASFGGPSAMVDHLPADALMAFTGHADVGRLVRHVIGEQWQKAARSGASPAGNDQNAAILAWALAPGLGPDWAGFLTPAHRTSVTATPALPFDLVFGIATRPLETDTRRPALAQNIEPLLHALLSAAVEAVNLQNGPVRAAIQSAEGEDSSDASRITVVSGIVPDRPQQELAYRVDEHGRLWLSTSREAMKHLSSAGKRLFDNREMQGQIASLGQPSGLVYVNLAAWRKLAKESPGTLDFIWQGKSLDATTKKQQFEEVMSTLQLADRLLLTSHLDRSTAHLSLSLSADEP